jgi:hypothetical protein
MTKQRKPYVLVTPGNSASESRCYLFEKETLPVASLKSIFSDQKCLRPEKSDYCIHPVPIAAEYHKTGRTSIHDPRPAGEPFRNRSPREIEQSTYFSYVDYYLTTTTLLWPAPENDYVPNVILKHNAVVTGVAPDLKPWVGPAFVHKTGKLTDRHFSEEDVEQLKSMAVSVWRLRLIHTCRLVYSWSFGIFMLLMIFSFFIDTLPLEETTVNTLVVWNFALITAVFAQRTMCKIFLWTYDPQHKLVEVPSVLQRLLQKLEELKAPRPVEKQA